MSAPVEPPDAASQQTDQGVTTDLLRGRNATAGDTPGPGAAAIRLLPGHDKRFRAGHPWVYANELAMNDAARALAPGSVVTLLDPQGRAQALVAFNPHSLIAARVLTRDRRQTIDREWFKRRIARALRLRQSLRLDPFARLVHAEADGLPGLVIDRFADVVAVQCNTAAMATQQNVVIDALRDLLAPATIVVRNDSPVRALEGLDSHTEVIGASLHGPIAVEENDFTYRIDPVAGQKTGWYYDQRPNRQFIAQHAAERCTLDLYSYNGGFGLLALAHGAAHVMFVDSSAPALGLAEEAAAAHGMEARASFARADAFTWLDQAVADKRRFDLTLADPPPFVRARKDKPSGLKAYRKLVRQLAAITAPEGLLALSSCSHHISSADLMEAARVGLREAQRPARLIYHGAAGSDHPLHPALAESAYLHALVWALD